ncbi:MAG: O-antigen ligase family protein [Candidatus Gastranaerophilales bacterium]|nr:O-antigen ligase family protein [Candidatus Gastranaerophilales bacterium]
MSILGSSLVYKFLKKMDVCENQVIKNVKGSFFLKELDKFINFIQECFSFITDKSSLVKHIDFLILMFLSLSLVSITFAPTKFIGLLAFTAFLLLIIKFFAVKGERHNFTSFDVPIFLYIAIAGISVAFSSLLLPSLKGYFKMIIYFAGYLTFFNILKNHPKRIIYMLCLIALTAAGESLYAICQQIIGIEALASWQDRTNVNPEQLMNRVYGSLKPFNPNLLAGYLIAAFSSALGMSFWCLVRKKWQICLTFFAATAAILLAILFTGSRGAYIAMAAMMLVFVLTSGHMIWHQYGHIKWLKKFWVACIILGVVGVICLVIVSPSLQHRVLSIFALRGDSSNSFRLNVYSACLNMFHDNWLIGIGPGNATFRLNYGLYMITGFDALGAYCVPLEVAVESGIFGLMAFLWILYLCAIKSVKYINSNNLIENKVIVTACLIGISGMTAHGFVDTIWYRPQVNLIFWLLVAILAVITSKTISTQKQD